MFADLNRYAIRPSQSLSILYDYRDEAAQLTKALIAQSSVFCDMVELEKTSLAKRSRRLFTLSAIYHATGELLNDVEETNLRKTAKLALKFWETVAEYLTEWQLVRQGEMTAGELREDYIHTHGVVLQALARVGQALMKQYPKQWPNRLAAVKTIDWRRSNSQLWEGRALIGGKVSKAYQNVTLTTNAIKEHMGLALSEDEQQIEDAFKRGNNGSKKR